MSLVNLTVSHCINCGCEYAIPTLMWNKQREEGGYHQCPNGHSQGWGKQSANEILRRENNNLKQQQARLEEEKRVEQVAREAAERKTKRVERRANAGVCLDCNRTFANVARHRATKHGPKCESVTKLKVVK